MITRSSKRRRRVSTLDITTPAEPDTSPPWPALQCDMVQLVGWRLLETGGDLLDYVRLRAVCAHWRSSTATPHGHGVAEPRFHPRRWMMLPEGHGLHPGHNKLRGYVRFINLSTGAIVRTKLPLFSHHCVLDSADGLLLLQRDHDSAVRLLHPFTGDVAELPPLLTLVRRFIPEFSPAEDNRETRASWYNFREVSSTCVSVGADGVITVMVVIKRMDSLAFATTMDQEWTVTADRKVSRAHRPISFQGRLYVLDYAHGRIMEVVPPRQPSPVLPARKLVAWFPTTEPSSWKYLYLAECDSEILLISFSDRFHTNMTVYRVADPGKKLVPATRIGGNVLMVSDRVLSVGSKVLPNVEGDSVVMLHGCDSRSFGQYRLATSTWSPAGDGSVPYGVQSPFSLIYHIYTRCYPSLWNKGEMCFQRDGSNYMWKVKRKWRHGT